MLQKELNKESCIFYIRSTSLLNILSAGEGNARLSLHVVRCKLVSKFMILLCNLNGVNFWM